MIEDDQRQQLLETIGWAAKIREHLQPLLDGHRQVHFRPGSQGVAMVGLLPTKPQRGRSGIRDLETLSADFGSQFQKHCVDVDQGRSTAEKELQSFLIAEAYRNDRKLASINAASDDTDPVDLVFVTDEIPLPTENGKIVCDVIAVRPSGSGHVPVLLELKSAREKTRLIEQVESYARLIDIHADLFAKLSGALLGVPIIFERPCEKWIVWPAADDGPERHEADLAARGIRVVSFTKTDNGYDFRVGGAPA